MAEELPYRRIGLYALVNVTFIVLVILLASIGASNNPRVAHVILLFLVCSSWIIDLNGLNGKYALLAIFQSFYFVSFALGDFNNLILGKSTEALPSLLSLTEAVILAGGVMLMIGYRAAVAYAAQHPRTAVQLDWRPSTTLTVGVVMWVVGTLSMFYWGVFIVTDTTIEATKEGLAKLSPLAIAANLLAGMLQPFGILLIAYAWRTSKSKWLLPIVVAVVLVQIVLGFVVNIKSLAMIAGILVIVTCVFVDGRLPKAWIAAGVVFVIVGFPILQASRSEVHGERHIARSTILENLGSTLGIALAAKDRVNTGEDRALTFLERTSVRGSVQMIVERTGEGVKFQNGYTLVPLLSSFIPRLLWPDKPDVATGRIVNKEFNVSEYEDTFISPSILGELYWNFGWAGVILGMALIGGAVGSLASRYDLSRGRSVTGLLVLVLTTKQLIVGFEGTFAPEYVVWFRSLAAIAILHVLFARVPVTAGSTAASGATSGGDLSALAMPKSFPNLLG